jgi:hypothetical protein
MDLARRALRSMTSISGDYLDLEPAFLIVGLERETEAKKFLSQEYLPNSQADINTFKNMSLIVDPRVTGPKWFVAADPSKVPTIELARLDGFEGTPQVHTRVRFETQDHDIRIGHDVGAAALDYRGLIYNPGE